MRIVLTTVLNASVTIEEKVVGQIGRGFCLLVGFTHSDTKEIVDKMIDKMLSLRVFTDEKGLTNLSLYDVKGEILSVSQFTLYADVTGGRCDEIVINDSLISEFESVSFCRHSILIRVSHQPRHVV